MCGRTACTLAPDEVPRACGFRDRRGQRRQPRWKDGDSSKYFPSHNVSPQSRTPVLVCSSHFGGEAQTEDRTLAAMQWGLVPSWFKGDPKGFGYKTNNARSDGMMTKGFFKGPLQKGQRCVVLADGYFEWQTGKDGKKQPYFIYFPQNKGEGGNLEKGEGGSLEDNPESGEGGDLKDNPERGEGGDLEEDSGAWQGRRLLTMAGIFDRWTPPEGGEPLYTYSVITVDAAPATAWIHHRMPAVLNGEAAVRDWLEHGRVPLNKAVELIQPQECLTFHPVSTVVNNSRNKSAECVAPVVIGQEKPTASSKMMSAWLQKGKPAKQGGGEKRPPPTPQPGLHLSPQGGGEKRPPPTPQPGFLLTSWLKRGAKEGEGDDESPAKKKKTI
ncbi:abasic site processing protein HMCES-like [Branchiostoma lanceolatum]|uniref:abasic site processing protein HMCES-like n=1 Tax=Branchiostoma lanceolatum TaxID=7740 RepID=UPI0034536673